MIFVDKVEKQVAEESFWGKGPINETLILFK